MADWRAPRFGSTAQAPAWTVSGPMDTGPTGGSLAGMMEAAGSTPPPPPGPSAQDLYYQQKAEQDAADRARMQEGTAAAVQAMFEQYGLGSMYGSILDYARKGYTADAILVHLRQTPEYKARFPAMEGLAKKGRAISEGAYIEYERTAATIEQRAGLPKGMLMGHVTDMLVNDVSSAELNDRVTIAVADSIMAPQDLKDTLRDYYGLDPDTSLAAYYLDPDVAMPLLEKQSAAARIGVWANRQGVSGVAKDMAEGLQGLGVNEQQAQQGFGNVAAQSGFQVGRGETANLQGLVDANLVGAEGARAQVQRIGQSRVGRFQSGGAFAESKSGVSGIGSSSA